MKPYFQHNEIKLYNADCRDIVHELGLFDMVLADPPYGETNLTWDTWPSGWVGDVRHALLAHGSMWCFGSMRMWWDHAVRAEFDTWNLSQEVIWEKHNGAGARSDRFRRVHEIPMQFYPALNKWGDIYKNPVYTLDAVAKKMYRRKSPSHYTPMNAGYYESADGGPKMMRSVIFARSCHGYAVNKTQKPLSIISPLIDYSCKPGGRILDPFSGSGSTLEYALRNGFSCVGIEKRESQCEETAKRLEKIINQPELFSKAA